MTLGAAAGRGALAIGLALAAGCATTHNPDVVRLERRIRELQDQIYVLEKDRQETEARLSRLEGREPAGALSTPAPAPAGIGEPVAAGSAPRPPVRALPPEQPVRESRPARTEGADAAWERAKGAYDQVRFGEAISLLSDFVERFPSDERAIEAQFLVGESYYAQANFPQAIVELGKVTQGYPSSARAADALYKVALCYYELGYEQNAREHLERLEKAYPGSSAAEAAKPLLERLRKHR